jgi:hypothetical protein
MKTEIKNQHTPMPWHIEETRMPSLGLDICYGSRDNQNADNHKWIGVVHGGHGENGETVSGFPSDEEGKVNAAYIVRAVNAHAELVMCLKEIVDDIPRINRKEFYRQVLAKAESQ